MKRTFFLLLCSFCCGASLNGQPNFTCSILDDAGVLWLGSSNEGLWQLDGNTPFACTIPEYEVKQDCFSMTLDRQGNVWIGGRDVLFEYDYNSWKFTDLNTNSSRDELAIRRNRVVYGISINHRGHALLGVEDETAKQSLLVRYNGESSVDFIKPFNVVAVYEDLSAFVWMADGAYRMEEGRLINKLLIPSGVIQCAIEDSRGNIWLGIDGEGVYKFDGHSFQHYGTDHGFENLRVSCLHEDEKGRIWMGTTTRKGELKKGVTYFEMGSFHHLQEAEGCPIHAVNTIASDKRGNIWFAGDGGELVRFNGRNFTVVSVPDRSSID